MHISATQEEMLDTMSECFSNCKGASKIALDLIPKDLVFWLRVCIMVLVYSFSVILRVILELIFKTPLQRGSKRLSLLTGIPSGNTTVTNIKDVADVMKNLVSIIDSSIYLLFQHSHHPVSSPTALSNTK